jgi:hypothetical protein
MVGRVRSVHSHKYGAVGMSSQEPHASLAESKRLVSFHSHQSDAVGNMLKLHIDVHT